jgi:hypothetical protein
MVDIFGLGVVYVLLSGTRENLVRTESEWRLRAQGTGDAGCGMRDTCYVLRVLVLSQFYLYSKWEKSKSIKVIKMVNIHGGIIDPVEWHKHNQRG